MLEISPRALQAPETPRDRPGCTADALAQRLGSPSNTRLSAV